MRGILKVDSKDQEYAIYILEDGENEVRFLLEKIGSRWCLCNFIGGNIGKTKYEKDYFNSYIYRKSGRGREPKEAREKIKDLYSRARDEIILL